MSLTHPKNVGFWCDIYAGGFKLGVRWAGVRCRVGGGRSGRRGGPASPTARPAQPRPASQAGQRRARPAGRPAQVRAGAGGEAQQQAGTGAGTVAGGVGVSESAERPRRGGPGLRRRRPCGRRGLGGTAGGRGCAGPAAGREPERKAPQHRACTPLAVFVQ